MTKKVLTFATFLALVFYANQHSAARPAGLSQQSSASALDVPVPMPTPPAPMEPPR